MPTSLDKKETEKKETESLSKGGGRKESGAVASLDMREEAEQKVA